MKIRILSLLTLFVMGLASISCSDDKDIVINDLEGDWKYSEPHIVFEYADPTIQIPNLPPLPSAGLGAILSKIADSKMSAYFKGVKIATPSELVLMMVVDGKEVSKTLNYTTKGEHLLIDIKEIIPQKMEMNTIALRYRIKDNALTCYLENITLQTMLQVPALQSIIASQIPGDKIPVEVKLKMVQEIIAKIKNMEVGFVVTK